MKRIKVLLVEDEATLAMIIQDTLTDQGFDIQLAPDGIAGLKSFFELRPDIVVADVMMPGMDGFEMLTKIRQMDKATPVLMLTARSAIKDVVDGFELGANDYLKKPFNMQELIVRIKALLHRLDRDQQEAPCTEFQIGNYHFNAMSQLLTCGQQRDELSHRESEILKRLCINRNNVVETKSILLDLWGDDSFFNTKSLHVFITKLRHKLENDNHVKIINVRGVGYKLILE